MPDNQTVVRQWLTALGALVASNQSVEEVRAKLGAYTPLLVAEFRPETFCQSSLADVARQCRFFPSFAELCEYLTTWAKEHRPPAPIALPPPDGYPTASSLNGMDLAWFNYYGKRAAEGFGPPHPLAPPSSRRNVLSLIKQQSPAAYAVLTQDEAPEWGNAA